MPSQILSDESIDGEEDEDVPEDSSPNTIWLSSCPIGDLTNELQIFYKVIFAFFII